MFSTYQDVVLQSLVGVVIFYLLCWAIQRKEKGKIVRISGNWLGLGVIAATIIVGTIKFFSIYIVGYKTATGQEQNFLGVFFILLLPVAVSASVIKLLKYKFRSVCDSEQKLVTDVTLFVPTNLQVRWQIFIGVFRNLFLPLQFRFKKMDTLMQNRVAISVSLAGFASRSAEDQLLPMLLPGLGIKIPSKTKRKIVTELAIGIVACLRIPAKTVLNDVWGLEGEALRQMMAMLVLSEGGDSRHVLENTQYSSNPDEARAQVLLAVIRLAGIKDDNIITRLNTREFSKEWNGFASTFVDGAITGFHRAPRTAAIKSVAGKLGRLTPRSLTLVEELIKRCANTTTQPEQISSDLLTPGCRAQNLFDGVRKKAESLRDQIKPMMGLPPMDLPQLQKFDHTMQIEWLRDCIPYCANLLFLAQIRKNIEFAKTDEFKVMYGQSLLLMASLEKEVAMHMEVSYEFDQNIAVTNAQNDFSAMETAVLFYIDNFKKEPHPDKMFIDLLMRKIGVPKELSSQVTEKLREFNSKAQTELGAI